MTEAASRREISNREWKEIMAARDELSILARHADRAEFVTQGLSQGAWAVMLAADAQKWRKAIVLAHRARKRERATNA